LSPTDITAADRWVRLPAAALDHRRFWDAMDTVSEAHLAQIEGRIGAVLVERFGLDLAGLVLDMTNFATFIDTGNERARSPNAGGRNRNAPTCGWSVWRWWSPTMAASRCCPTPTPATGPTSPSSPP
jgi:hypothetical protein